MNAGQLTQAIAAQIDRARMEALRERFADAWAVKFFDVPTYCQRAAEKAIQLGLHESTGQRILDIGGGFGYFALAAKILGHHPLVMEVAHEVIDAVFAVMPVPLIRHHVSAGVALPELGEPFDLITIMGVNFDYPAKWWTEADYRFLVGDLCSRLSDQGVIHIEHNRGKETDFLAYTKWSQPFSRMNNITRIRKNAP